MLQLREFDSSIRARLKLIELSGTIPEADRKPSHVVRAELEKEGESILNLVVQEMLKARTAGGLAAIEPESLKQAVEDAIDGLYAVLAWANMRLSPLCDLASGAAWMDLARDSGLPFSALVSDFEMRFHPINRNTFAQRLCKILKIRSKDLPLKQDNGVRERWYPLTWAG